MDNVFLGQSTPKPVIGAAPAVPPLPEPTTTPPSQLMTPDTLIKGFLHSVEHGLADVVDFLGKDPTLRDLGYKLYGMSSARPKDSAEVPNIGSVAPGLYRGAQPSAAGLQTLKADGVQTVINLRPEAQWEKPIVEALGMKYVYMPLPPVGPPTNEQAMQFLSTVTDPASGKVFFHCQHGADRTGAMAAAYRIAVDGWTADQAIAEMGQYHFHAGFEDEKLSFVRGFATYWAGLPEATRAQVLHGIQAAAPAPAGPAGPGPALPAADTSAPNPLGAQDSGGSVAMTAGNSAQLFVDRKNSFQEAMRLVNGAQTSIQFETFTFNGQMAQDLAQAMIAARARGVNVQVVLDPKSLLVSDAKGLADMLRAHGVDVRTYKEQNLNDPVVAIDHAKMLLVDAQKALVGDSNFDRYEDYDMDYEVQGPILPRLQAMFAQSWQNSDQESPPVTAGLPPVAPIPVADGTPVQGGDATIGATETAPRTDAQVGAQTYQNVLGAIQQSTRSIDVLMYTMDDTQELAALKEAAKRGVKVRVVLSPSKTAFNLKAVEDLQQAGIDVRWFKLEPGMKEMHAKVAVFDGTTMLGGSTNWTHSSNTDNHELGLWMQGAIAGQVDDTFNQVWDQQTEPVTPLSPFDKVKAEIMDGISRVL